jgi:prepilin-type N-terminal cleavage/methylation domain-containing protein
MRLTREKSGFSILELMIAVAIVTILVSIAIPAYQVFARRARSSEAIYQTNAISTHQASYRSTYDTYLTLPRNPPGAVPFAYQTWGNPGGNWSKLGFKISRRFRYQYRAEPGSTNDITTSYKIFAQTDFDCAGDPYDTWERNSDGELLHTDRYK